MIQQTIITLNELSTIILVASFSALIYKTVKRVIRPDNAIFLGIIILIYLFVCAGNLLEHSGISMALDFYEDFAEMMVPLFILILLNSMRLHSLLDERAKNMIELSDRLRERDELIKGIHHRVKNNLQIVVSIISLLRNAHDENKTIERILMALENRIFSMSAVYDTVGATENYAVIPAGQFIKKIGEQVACNIPCEIRNKKISLFYDIDASINFTIEYAVTLGMLVNEIITNAYLHAFKGRDEGSITISLKKIDGETTLSIRDNGIGVRSDRFENGKTTMGAVLIKNLSEQIKGTYFVSTENGTTVTVRFGE